MPGSPVVNPARSRLSRARGLKPNFAARIEQIKASRLSRARGLKRFNDRQRAARVWSRLSRARGLKPCRSGRMASLKTASRLSRARGLKRARIVRRDRLTVSRLSRARGLKLRMLSRAQTRRRVAPFTGAWIETSSSLRRSGSARVAPFTGAWIETTNRLSSFAPTASRLSRARGLKREGTGWL